MNKKVLEEALKNIEPEKIDKAKSLLDGSKNISELLSGIDIKKAAESLSALNIDPSKLGGILSEIKKNPDVLNEVKNKLK